MILFTGFFWSIPYQELANYDGPKAKSTHLFHKDPQQAKEYFFTLLHSWTNQKKNMLHEMQISVFTAVLNTATLTCAWNVYGCFGTT